MTGSFDDHNSASAKVKNGQLLRIKQMLNDKRKTELTILYEHGPRVYSNNGDTRKEWDFGLKTY